MNMRRWAAGALALVCVCCRAPRAVARDAPVPVHVTIVRNLPRDTANVTRGVSALVVIVRNVDKPEDAVAGTTVVLDSARGFVTKADGVARFDSVPNGDHQLSFRRIGFVPVTARVKVPGGCEARVEVYLPPSAYCLFSCPSSSPRVVLSTCRPKA